MREVEQRERASGVDDIATQVEERDREQALEAQRRRAELPGLPPGECANCGAMWKDERHFCDAECREDYETRQRIARITGKAP